MSQKKKQKTENVQPATENTQEEEVKPSAVIPEEQAQAAPAQSVLFDLSQFPKDKIEMAESLGIPISFIADKMNSWAASVEARFNILAEGVDKNPQRTIALLQQEVNKEREQYQKQHPQGEQPRGPSGLGGLGELLPLLGPLLGTASPNDQLMQTFMASAMQNTIESQGLGNAFLKAIISRLAPQYADEVAAKMPQLEVKK